MSKSKSQSNLVPKSWYQNDSEFFIQSVQSTIPQLPVGVYKLEKYQFGLKLVLLSENFSLPSKLYGTTTNFINRVLKTWNNTSDNLGVLLWGLKGTSKTVTSKIICNELKLPVIIVPESYDGFASFIENISQDIILFFDEFEKSFGAYHHEDENASNLPSLLSLIDGTNTNLHRRLWLFTSNSQYVDKNLLDRPSRVRYAKEFKSLDREVILEIVEDLLKVENKDRYEKIKHDLLVSISRLEFITIDSVFSLTEEVNIHQELASELITDFNLSEKIEKFQITKIKVSEEDNSILVDPETGEPEVKLVGVFQDSQISKVSFDSSDEGDSYYIKRTYVGTILEVINENQVIIKSRYNPNSDREIFDKDEHLHWLFTLEPVYSSIFDYSAIYTA